MLWTLLLFDINRHRAYNLVMKIIVDADACPKTALRICLQVGGEFSIPVWTVASFNHNITSHRQFHHHIVVGDSQQETDIRIANHTKKGDVVVTQDWGLAALALGKDAAAISPSGRIFRKDDIEFLLEEREIKARLRRSGKKTKGPRRRTKEMDKRFEKKLRQLLNSLALPCSK